MYMYMYMYMHMYMYMYYDQYTNNIELNKFILCWLVLLKSHTFRVQLL